jgi:hypothetical protein
MFLYICTDIEISELKSPNIFSSSLVENNVFMNLSNDFSEEADLNI